MLWRRGAVQLQVWYAVVRVRTARQNGPCGSRWGRTMARQVDIGHTPPVRRPVPPHDYYHTDLCVLAWAGRYSANSPLSPPRTRPAAGRKRQRKGGRKRQRYLMCTRHRGQSATHVLWSVNANLNRFIPGPG